MRPLVLLMILLGAGGARAADKAGCSDPSWAPARMPGFEIGSCESRAWVSRNVGLASGRKTIEGPLESVTYRLVDQAQNPAALPVRNHYADGLAAKNGATVVSSARDGFTAYLVKGDTYYMYDHGSGSDKTTGSYTIWKLHLEPPAQVVEARPVTAVLDTKATCADPPWLVKNLPAFKLESCKHRDFDSVVVHTASGNKTIAGRVLEQRYALTDPKQNPVAAFVGRNFENALGKIGATRASRPEDLFQVVMTQKSDVGEIWFGYLHGAGNESSTTQFRLLTVEVGGPPPKACTLEIYGVNFDTDKSTLRPDADPVLAQVLALFKDDAKMTAELSGHTDDRGTHEHNQTLSAARADAVKAWLVAHGVDDKRVTTHGYGDTKPLVPNSNDDNRAKNRRVELKRNDCKG